jgi:hypothetical protein
MVLWLREDLAFVPGTHLAAHNDIELRVTRGPNTVFWSPLALHAHASYVPSVSHTTVCMFRRSHEHIKIIKRGVGDLVQWKSTCLARSRPWVRSSALKTTTTIIMQHDNLTNTTWLAEWSSDSSALDAKPSNQNPDPPPPFSSADSII